jgi:hypothetical protein
VRDGFVVGRGYGEHPPSLPSEWPVAQMWRCTATSLCTSSLMTSHRNQGMHHHGSSQRSRPLNKAAQLRLSFSSLLHSPLHASKLRLRSLLSLSIHSGDAPTCFRSSEARSRPPTSAVSTIARSRTIKNSPKHHRALQRHIRNPERAQLRPELPSTTPISIPFRLRRSKHPPPK